jgi:hypothetical protein
MEGVGDVKMKNHCVLRNKQVLFFYGAGRDLKGAILKGKEAMLRALFET